MTDAVRGAMDMLRTGLPQRHDPPERGHDEPFVLHEDRRADDAREDERTDVGYGKHREASQESSRRGTEHPPRDQTTRRGDENAGDGHQRERFQFRRPIRGRAEGDVRATLQVLNEGGSADRLVRGLERLMLQRGQTQGVSLQVAGERMAGPSDPSAPQPAVVQQLNERQSALPRSEGRSGDLPKRSDSAPTQQPIVQPNERAATEQQQLGRMRPEVSSEPPQREAAVNRVAAEALRMMNPERPSGTRHVSDITATLQAWKRAAGQTTTAAQVDDNRQAQEAGPSTFDLELIEQVDETEGEQLSTLQADEPETQVKPTVVSDRASQALSPGADTAGLNAMQPVQQNPTNVNAALGLLGGDGAADAAMEELIQVRHANQMQIKASATDATIRVPTADAGSLEVKLRRAGEDLQVKMKAEDAATRRVMLEAFPELRQEFNRANIVEGKVDVQEDMSGDLLASDDEFSETDGFDDPGHEAHDERMDAQLGADGKPESEGGKDAPRAPRHDGQLHLVA